MLQVHESLWLADGEIVKFFGTPYPTRCAIVRLASGDLWIWSPIKLSTGLRAEVDQLGPVRHLVSPNKLHYLYLREWKEAYPDSLLWGPRSTIKKCSDLSFHQALTDKPPADWAGDIDQAWFRGSFAMDEIVFCHRPSATAIVADLIQTFSPEFLRREWGRWSFFARLSGLTQDKGYAPIDLRLSFINRAPGRAARDKVLSWDCQRLIVAHGEWLASNAEAQIAKSFAWLS